MLADVLAACRDVAPIDAAEQARILADAEECGRLFTEDGGLLTPSR